MAKQKNYTKASQVLCLSQPTLSKMVKNLEKALVVELLDRSSKKVVLTVAGEIVFEKGQKILGSFEVYVLCKRHDESEKRKLIIKIDIKMGHPSMYIE